MMHLRFITYFTWLGDELVTVPGFPAWICDVCGRRQYDQRAISWLSTMLNPETGCNKGQRPQIRHQSKKTKPVRQSSKHERQDPLT